MSQATNNSFGSSLDMLGDGVDALFSGEGPQYSLIPLDMIVVKKQIREIFEDEENSLKDLAASIKERGILQPILLRPIGDEYELIAGERRYRAAKIAGLDEIPAYIRLMSDEEAEDAQMAENIHRKNLTQIEEAKKIQRDLDKAGGNIDAVLARHQKSRAWISKMLSLLDLPQQSKRLVSENVSADVEVINSVKQIEKINPTKAKELVDGLKESRGKENAREKVAKVKEEVKPKKAKSEPQRIPEQNLTGIEEVPHHREEKTAEISTSVFSPSELLNKIYVDIFEKNKSSKIVLNDLSKTDKEAIESYLYPFFEASKQSKNLSQEVIQGFRKGHFSSDGEGAFALITFLQAISGEKFNLLNILGAVQQG